MTSVAAAVARGTGSHAARNGGSRATAYRRTSTPMIGAATAGGGGAGSGGGTRGGGPGGAAASPRRRPGRSRRRPREVEDDPAHAAAHQPLESGADGVERQALADEPVE